MTAIALPLSNQSIMKTPEAEGQQSAGGGSLRDLSDTKQTKSILIVFLKHFPDDTKSLIEILSGLAEEQPGGGAGGPGGPHGEAVLGLWQGGRGPQQPQDVHRVQGGQVLRQVDIQGVAVRCRVLQLDAGCSDVLSAGTVRGKSGKFTSCFTKSWSTQEIF